MVGTRSASRRKLEDEEAMKSANQPIDCPPPTLEKTEASRISRSARTSEKARRAQLVYEAAQKKALLQMDLIEKKLAADLAELDSCGTQSLADAEEHNERESRTEQWVKTQRVTCDNDDVLGPAPRQDALLQQENASPPLPRLDTLSHYNQPGTENNTMHMLACAVKDLAAAATSSNNNSKMLNRLCTSKELPKFEGDPLDWLQFKQAYEESSKVCQFSDQENLWRLRKCLHGRAKEAVTSLLIGATSPDVVISTLQLQFGNPDTIMSRIMVEIHKLRPLHHDYRMEIIPFAVKIQNCVAAVTAIGCEDLLNGLTLISAVLAKLPTILLSKWTDYSFPIYKESARTKAKFIILSDFLKLEAEKVSQCNINLPNFQQPTVKNNNDYSKQKSQTVLVNCDQNISSDKCKFCNISQHALPDCRKFKKALRKDRWSYVKRNGICFKCLSARHLNTTCPAAVCDVTACGQSHHRLLHYVPSSRLNAAAATTAGVDRALSTAVTPASPSQSTSATSASEIVTHVTTNANNDWSVLLKVVPINIHGPNGVFSASALLDDGSTVSMISASLAARAGLRGRKQTMQVRGAWNDTVLVCEAELVDLTLSNKLGEKYDICVRSVNELNLPKQNSTNLKCENYGHLCDIKNKVCFTSQQPDILIGQDNYHLILPLQTIVGKPSEPCATRTPLGWCLHGRIPTRQDTQQYTALCISNVAVAPRDDSAIDELTRIHEWRYVPTKLNVADIATRENYECSILQNDWLRGPAFLYKNPEDWPLDVIDPVNKDILECLMITDKTTESLNLPVPEPARFSSWLRLLRATQRVLTFVDNILKAIRNKIQSTCNFEVDVMDRAERLLLRHSQALSFGSEIGLLRASKALPTSSKLLTLSPYLDEHGVLRCGGRIDAASEITQDVKQPVILDGRSHITHLIVKHYHQKAFHGNQEMVVNELKQKYWIIRIRPTVKHVASKCMLCRIRRAQPRPPRMGDLPEGRLAHHQRPFTYSGVDLFGPMEVTIGRRREKRYGVLFTCLTVRAIHIELVGSLTTDDVIMALRRMAARRGWPRHLFSDNGTNLRGADKELKKCVSELDQELLSNGVQSYSMTTSWTFSPPASPHWGGAWERLIRCVKNALKIVLKEKAPREAVLHTLMTEVEVMVNSRPLTHVSVEPNTDESLTPNHFLLGSSSNLPTIGSFDESATFLRKQWRFSQRLADLFWRRWVKEVLPDMRPRKKWQREERPIQIGDLVLIVDPGSPRNVWPRGVIQQVMPGKDGRVRVAEVKTKSGILRRPVARIAHIPTDDEC